MRRFKLLGAFLGIALLVSNAQGVFGADIDIDGDIEVRLVDPITQNAASVDSDGRVLTSPSAVEIIPYNGKVVVKHLILDGSEPYTLTKGSMNVDGSGTAKNFYRVPPSGKIWYISKVKITIVDSSINHDKFGGISGGLTNGILFKVTENGTERDFYEHSLKTNGAFYHISTKVEIDSSTTDILSVMIDFSDLGSKLELKNSTSDNFKVVVQDNLTTLDFMEVTIFGYEVDA